MSDQIKSPNIIEIEYEEIMTKNAWPLVYQKIGQEAFEFQYDEAKKPHNKPLNRYRDVNPYDHTRVILRRCERDYINANIVKMERANRVYILTQGPLAFTVSHFWLMVWEQNSRAILMLNKIVEKSEIKCHWYWPRGNGDEHKLELQDVNLVVEQLREEDFNYYSTRVFLITDLVSAQSREVVQFHYTTWPDFGVPSSPVAFLDFLRKVRESGALNITERPAVVHCSAGIGRSGTFCLVDSCLEIIEREGPASVNVQQMLVEMRKYRMGLIQTPDQLRFSYQAIIEGIKRLDPDWVANADENAYSVAEESDEAPPPPPPRGESLAMPPARPLPAIPTSSSLGILTLPTAHESSSDENPPTPLVLETPTPASSADDEDDESERAPDSGSGSGSGSVETVESLRRRRARDMAERVANMKKRARDSERWHSLKRFKQESQTNTEPRED